MNSVNIIGIVATEIETINTAKGNRILKFRLQHIHDKDLNGDRHLSFFNVVAFGKYTYAEKFLFKGQRIGVTGMLKQSSYNSKIDGGHRENVDIIVSKFQFIDWKETEKRKDDEPEKDNIIKENVTYQEKDNIVNQEVNQNEKAVIKENEENKRLKSQEETQEYIDSNSIDEIVNIEYEETFSDSF